MPFMIRSGISSRSFSFRRGIMISRMPARFAAMTFSLIAPTGSTFPVNVTSPVMATSLRTFRFKASDASAAAMATPALGPSFGTAPDGTWR